MVIVLWGRKFEGERFGREVYMGIPRRAYREICRTQAL